MTISADRWGRVKNRIACWRMRNVKMTDAASAFLILRAPPNPDMLCHFSRLTDDLPRLWLGAIEQADADETTGVAGARQGAGRFFWDSIALPACCTAVPFKREAGDWKLMFHLWRPRETGTLQSRVYLVRCITDSRQHQWRYSMFWPDAALGTSPRARDFTVPINLNSCLRPLLMTAYVHMHRPRFAFDLRLNAGPATIYSVTVDHQEVEARLRVQQGEAVLFDRTGTIRDLSMRCDGAPCASVVGEATPESRNLLITADVDAGPWGGRICMSEEHLQI